MMTTRVLLTSLALISAWSGSHGYNSGAPVDTCVSMLPGTVPGASGGGEGHTADTQNNAPLYGNSVIAPYTLEVSGTQDPPREVQSGVWLEVNPGMSYQLNIIADQSTQGNLFKGILLMAREIVCFSNDTVQVNDEPIGTFTVSTGTPLTPISCGQIPNSAISHNSPNYKINEQVTWTAPANQKLNVIFRATIVQSLNVYWTEVYSKPLHIAGAPTPLTCSSISLHLQSLRSLSFTPILLITFIQTLTVVYTRLI